ncbi:hypothetical protein GCM10009677_57460 [Sphaerisporangium rubeum]|uniref:S-DNA-T family DNA segregation ATPase FtsK/SpoIIIE n=1 Tax=Sphaerisporangium rubeum TaxID=321317 RepID=A0A7X0IG58_9ACTN|nr:S-DNA-T family DNA segregation ATPase FtsK/SpoIIIE [Sphaerisporangium rubeum]
MTDFLLRLGVYVFAVALALWCWRRWHRLSFWLVVGYPVKLLTVYCTWRAVASGCGLARRRRRFRWTFPGFPGLGG